MGISDKELSFHHCCVQRTKPLCKLLKADHQVFEKWLDFWMREIRKITNKGQYEERVENSTIISLTVEGIDCFDGIGVLHIQGCVNAAAPLIRKLMELYFQIIYILQNDTENKALAYEAWYVSRKTQGGDDSRNVYWKYDKYNEYKAEADKIYNNNSHGYPEWYEVYGRVENQGMTNSQLKKILVDNIKKMCDEIGERTMYDKIYNYLSKQVHGFLARDRICLNSVIGKNYIDDFRNPAGIGQQTALVNLLMIGIYRAMCNHYGIIADYAFVKNQLNKVQFLRNLETQYNDFIQQQNESLNQRWISK